MEKSHNQLNEFPKEQVRSAIQNGIAEAELQINNKKKNVHIFKLKKRKRSSIILVSSICLLIVAASPTIASMAISITDWMKNINSNAVIRAFEDGIGQEIAQSDEYNGTNFTVLNAFVDDNQTVINFSFDINSGLDYDEALFSKFNVNLMNGREYAYYDDESRKLVGSYVSEEGIKSSLQNVDISVEDIFLYQNKRDPFELNWDEVEFKDMSESLEGVEKLEIQSVRIEGEELLIQYETKYLDEENTFEPPMLEMIHEGTLLKRTSVVGKELEKGSVPITLTYNLNGVSVQELDVFVTYSERVAKVDGSWKVSFDLDKTKADQATIVKELDDNIIYWTDKLHLEQLTITPTLISIKGKKNQIKNGIEIVGYDEISLRIGDQTYEGGYFPSNKSKFEFQFRIDQPLPPIIEDISLKLNDASVQTILYPDSPSLVLTNISNEKQTVTSNVADYPVEFTYHMIDGDVIIESSSSNLTYQGLQTYYIDQKDKRQFARKEDIGLFNKQINTVKETYFDYQDSSMELFIYSYSKLDKDRVEVMNLN
ncbi:DUF4179 domain-containing protein [Chengkuizengella axinellae]|uniref:DUF4179 domain-containing protein n=1 Tax=Chengkuizengella axinellae TaxID=3064388 RepID=A0ABT9IZP0_9BACL|nr:DUF4179 domain-containing protein [Chengkuizengella sp. 2205SS18-9]MDP5274797.1 DUF4179 domain-containing protein [Chengkuizengella sp. 2205SS18-9]